MLKVIGYRELISLSKLTQQKPILPYIASIVWVQECLNFLIQIFNNSSIAKQSALLLVMLSLSGHNNKILSIIIGVINNKSKVRLNLLKLL